MLCRMANRHTFFNFASFTVCDFILRRIQNIRTGMSRDWRKREHSTHMWLCLFNPLVFYSVYRTKNPDTQENIRMFVCDPRWSVLRIHFKPFVFCSFVQQLQRVRFFCCLEAVVQNLIRTQTQYNIASADHSHFRVYLFYHFIRILEHRKTETKTHIIPRHCGVRCVVCAVRTQFFDI